MDVPGAVMGVIVLGALACWLFAVIHLLLAMGHLREGQSASTFLWNGMAAFDAESFSEKGQRYQRRFVGGFVAFFLWILLAIAVGAMVIGTTPPKGGRSAPAMPGASTTR